MYFSLIIFAILAIQRAISKDVSRVSWKECKLDPGLRHDCGYYGIKEGQCYNRGCCWAESKSPDTPWCYHSKVTTTPRCMVSGEERIACGTYGMRKEQCLAKKCCWQPSNEADVPWCYHRKQIQLQEGECGVPSIHPNVLSSARIVGGVEARPNSWPWQVSLQIVRSDGSGRHFCGASIINKNWIVSAAHCRLPSSYESQVALGVHSLNQTNTLMQKIEIEEWFPHELYGVNDSMSNDIMLIRTKEPITFNEHVSPVCLPKQDQEFQAGKKCYVTGWGTTTLYGESPNELQQVGLPILEPETCQNWYTDPKNFYGQKNITIPITESMICAGYEEGGRSGCHGDSGGPFVCYSGEKWTLAGAVSWGGECGYAEVASVFARVSMFVDWMRETIDKYEQKRK